MIRGWREPAHPLPSSPPNPGQSRCWGTNAHPPDAINISPLLVVGSRTPGNSCSLVTAGPGKDSKCHVSRSHAQPLANVWGWLGPSRSKHFLRVNQGGKEAQRAVGCVCIRWAGADPAPPFTWTSSWNLHFLACETGPLTSLSTDTTCCLLPSPCCRQGRN